MKQFFGTVKRPDHATFSSAKSMTFPIFENADTQSANYKKKQFLPLFENYATLEYQEMLFTAACVLKFAHSMHTVGVSILESHFFPVLPDLPR